MCTDTSEHVRDKNTILSLITSAIHRSKHTTALIFSSGIRWKIAVGDIDPISNTASSNKRPCCSPTTSINRCGLNGDRCENRRYKIPIISLLIIAFQLAYKSITTNPQFCLKFTKKSPQSQKIITRPRSIHKAATVAAALCIDRRGRQEIRLQQLDIAQRLHFHENKQVEEQ